MKLKNLFYIALALLHVFPAQSQPESRQALLRSIKEIASAARGRVFVACALPADGPAPWLDCNLDPHGHPPMQSVFKLPLGVTVLHLVDVGRFKLDQPVHFAASDRMPGTHSPMQDKFPAADLDVPLRDMLRYAVSDSDNVATDILLRLVGGPFAVRAYLSSLGIQGIRVMDGEHGLARDRQVQYQNWTEPSAMVALLRRIADHSPLSPASAAFLEDIMAHGSTGLHRLRGLLPPGTLVEHKTGTSGADNGLAPATNDVGLITLPNGVKLALAVFVTDSHADEATRDNVIARIAQAVYVEAQHTSRK